MLYQGRGEIRKRLSYVERYSYFNFNSDLTMIYHNGIDNLIFQKTQTNPTVLIILGSTLLHRQMHFHRNV